MKSAILKPDVVIENLTHRYTPESRASLVEVNLSVQPGECIAIMGATGSGKSTLLYHMAGLLDPQQGTIRTLRKTGLLFQRPEDQLFKPTVEEDVAFGPFQRGYRGDALEQHVRYGFDTCGLDYDRYRERYIHTLSGGEKRKAAFAGILAMKPEILLLDEPAAGLDPVSRRNFIELIRRLNDSGMTVILITHHMEVADTLSGTFLVLDKGKTVFYGSKEELFSRPQVLREFGLELPFHLRLSEKLEELGWDMLEKNQSAASVLDKIIFRLSVPGKRELSDTPGHEKRSRS